MPRTTIVDNGTWDEGTVKALQKFLARNGADPGPVDGSWTDRTKRALATFLCRHGYYKNSSGMMLRAAGMLMNDSGFGVDSVEALQLWLIDAEGSFGQRGVDGIWGPGTTRSLQRFLMNAEASGKRWCLDDKPVSGTLLPMEVNGSFDSVLVMALQEYLLLCGEAVGPIDGSWGEQSKLAMRNFLIKRGYYACTGSSMIAKAVGQLMSDSDFGMCSVKALQAWLYDMGSLGRLGVDGVWGPKTTRGLQSFLNSIPTASESIPLPPHWACDDACSQQLRPNDAEVISMFQTVFDGTWQDIKTRDRRTDAVPRLVVVAVQQNENPLRWRLYQRYRKALASDISLQPDEVVDVKTTSFFAGSSRGMLAEGVNEAFLYHGTKPSAALDICRNGFSVDLAGSRTGTLYGNGVYFAEKSTKSDEYADDDKEGLYGGMFCILVCRVTLGRCFYTDEARPDHKKIEEACLRPGARCHSVLGDREKARGTYREFVVFEEERIYPEYVIIYRREAA
eukprot:TRINITY_DN58966_c0_g1_i1.p1 TRINITY_DN58966_c0_g1~~TRINITY_DN58966_c0_g1_i1.p1  ORF type:complete len:506 (-),score=48.26 TRINITY_DN58966_c0_g1_i1:289-1806(-)